MSGIVWRRPCGDREACPEVTVLGTLIGVRDSQRPGGQAYFTVAAFETLLAGDWSAEIAATKANAREVT